MNEALHRIALAWLEKARHDLETARRMVQGTDPITDTAVYHCQQAAEKALKAVLVAAGHPVFKTHDLKSQIQARGQTPDESTRVIQH